MAASGVSAARFSRQFLFSSFCSSSVAILASVHSRNAKIHSVRLHRERATRKVSLDQPDGAVKRDVAALGNISGSAAMQGLCCIGEQQSR